MILKEFYNAERLCRTWNDDLVYNKVMETVDKSKRSKDMDFRKALFYGIEQWKFRIQRQIAMDDDNSDEDEAEDDDTRMQHST